MKKQLLSYLLVLILVISTLPCTVYAKDAESDDASEEYGSFVSGEAVISDMIEKNGENTHPRIIMTNEKFAALRSHIGDASVTSILLEELRSDANRLCGSEVSKYTDYDGNHLETAKRIQRRVASLALAYQIFGEEKYAKRCYQELAAACEFPDWNPSHFLDPSEMCTAFAYGYDWLYNWMTPEQRTYLKTNMIKKGLDQVMQDYTDTPSDRKRTYKWYQDAVGDNWQLVCTGGTDLAALAIGDEEDAKEIASEVLTYGYKRAYSFVRRAYSTTDGTYIEGLGYWDYATYYLGLQSSAFITATGTDYGLADYEGIQKSADFVRYMSSNTPKSFSFGDDRESRDTGWAVFLWLGEHLNSPEISAIRLRKIDVDPEFNYLDVLWIDESKQVSSDTENATDWGAVGACNASFRDTWDESGLVSALHVGENCYKYHGHYDLGSFYIESNGSRFFTDLGNESYSLENRQVSYRIKAEGHNTLVINPTQKIDQKEGANCLITEFSSGREAYAITDLTDAYEPSGANRVIRGLKMIKDKKCVVIQDEISLDQPGEIYWFAHTKGAINIAADGRSAVVTVGDDKMWVGLLSEDGELAEMEAKPLSTSLDVKGATSNSEYRKLAIHLTNTQNAEISVACIPLKEGETSPSWTPSLKALSAWGDASEAPSTKPSAEASETPSTKPSAEASQEPSTKPSTEASEAPSTKPSAKASQAPSTKPSATASETPSTKPSAKASETPSTKPSAKASQAPSTKPSATASETPSTKPSAKASQEPSTKPSAKASEAPSTKPSAEASKNPSVSENEVPAVSASLPGKAPEVGAQIRNEKTNGYYRVTSSEDEKREVSYEKSIDQEQSSCTIPATLVVDDVTYKVTKIEKGAFKKEKKLIEVVVGKNVKSIGKDAFYKASKLTKVSLSKNVESIGTNAFRGCVSLKTLTLGTKVNSIGSNAFNGCKKLKTLTIKSTKLTNKNVAKNAFKGLTKVTTIKVPKKKRKAYKALFKKKGLSSKVKVVAYK